MMVTTAATLLALTYGIYKIVKVTIKLQNKEIEKNRKKWRKWMKTELENNL